MAALAAAAITVTAAQAATLTPQVNGLFKVLKADGSTVVGQAVITPGGGPLAVINVRQADALVAANGRCAFNVKYDEVSNVAAQGTVNRLYSNDTLIAQNSAIDLQPGVLRTIWTQPYLYAGVNNVKVVVNANAATPSIGWVRIVVDGTCNGAAAPKPPAAQPKPVTPPPPPVVYVTAPGAQWNALYNAWGYSNYATTQLKTRNFARYAEVVSVNAALTEAVKAGKVELAAYQVLMARWNALANDAAFKAAMAGIVVTPGRI
jgi:hypothetical protein